jgi:threonine/homoserine/homoserine lactone efflux protein
MPLRWETWALFLVTETTLCLTPGPAVLVLSQGLCRGSLASIFTALLPQFIDPTGNVPAQVMVLGVSSVVVEFSVLAAYGTLAGRATALASRPRFATLTNRIAGSLGVGAAAIRRR